MMISDYTNKALFLAEVTSAAAAALYLNFFASERTTVKLLSDDNENYQSNIFYFPPSPP